MIRESSQAEWDALRDQLLRWDYPIDTVGVWMDQLMEQGWTVQVFDNKSAPHFFKLKISGQLTWNAYVYNDAVDWHIPGRSEYWRVWSHRENFASESPASELRKDHEPLDYNPWIIVRE